ncbi:zinc ribbon domain-containing protein [Ornithinibacillus contaminans]|uniref:zinc ribbon domain-containing protein n=1 Tax=Ornithinibacillus contaminans TaxID=694055 RepID=UPI0012ED87DB
MFEDWTCPVCHNHHDRDINASKNISPTDIHLPLIIGLRPSPDGRGSLLSGNDKTC